MYPLLSGPLLGQLKGGKDITLADGTLVRSADVTEPDEVGAVFISKLDNRLCKQNFKCDNFCKM